MDDAQRKHRAVELEAEYRRTETALAVAVAAHESAFAALWQFVNEDKLPGGVTLIRSPDLVVH
jgi:hypothetical protein